MRQRLSVVILTKNEEVNIAECIESAKWADEVVVVDDNSTDATVEIARRYTNKILLRPLDGNFASQRNAGTDIASGDWILQMDADERITGGLKAKISELLEKDNPDSAFRFTRLNYFCGMPLRHGGEDSHKPLRLFKKGKARFVGEKIHEVLSVDGPIGEIDAVMDHYNFSDISHYVLTQDFYTGLEARALCERSGIISKSRLKSELRFGPTKLFLKIYLRKKGYKDGYRGLIFAALSAWRRFLIYAKYWEMNKAHYG